MNLNFQRKKIIFLLNEITDHNYKKKCEEYEKLIFEISKKTNYEKLAYEKLGEIQFIVNNKKDLEKLWDKLFEDLKTDKKVWESSIFENLKIKKLSLIQQNMFDGAKLQKCEFPCRNKKCRSDQCYFYTEQTRSGDEGSTCFVCCARCSHRYKFG
jgi:DNA-directed RNA polymerase subunit M/transcription elongation factor TFIIS